MATTLDRSIVGLTPFRTTGLQLPPPILSVGHSGKVNTRGQLAIGRRWTETYRFPMASPMATTGRQGYALLQSYFRNGTFLNLQHQYYLTTLGAAGGTPLVNGASQTGTSLITDGWPNSTAILKAGDLITGTTTTTVYEQTVDVSSDGSGNATLTLNPPIFTGGELDNNAAIVVTATAVFTAIIIDLSIQESAVGELQEVSATYQESAE